jgi:hypothetical protein
MELYNMLPFPPGIFIIDKPRMIAYHEMLFGLGF